MNIYVSVLNKHTMFEVEFKILSKFWLIIYTIAIDYNFDIRIF